MCLSRTLNREVLAAPRLDSSLQPVATPNTTAGSGTPVAEPQTVAPRRKRRTRTCWQRLLLTALVFVGSLYGLITLGRTAFDNFIREQEAHAAASRTQQVLVTLQSLASDLHAAESGARGFAISGQQSHLINIMARQTGTPGFMNFRRGLAGRFGGIETVPSLEALIIPHLAVLKEMVDLGSKNVFRAVGQRSFDRSGL